MKARTNYDINQWLKFFLIGVIEMSKKGVETFDGILQLQRNIEDKLKAFGNRTAEAMRIVEHLYQRPIIDAAIISKITGKSKATNYKLLSDFERIGILKEVTGGQRNKFYEFTEYLSLFNS